MRNEDQTLRKTNIETKLYAICFATAIFLLLSVSAFSSPQPELPGRQFSHSVESGEETLELRGTLRLLDQEQNRSIVFVLDEQSIGLSGGASLLGLIGRGAENLDGVGSTEEIILQGRLVSPREYRKKWADEYPQAQAGLQGYFLIGPEALE